MPGAYATNESGNVLSVQKIMHRVYAINEADNTLRDNLKSIVI